MIVALAFCKRDQGITLKLAEWIQELGGCKNHKLLLCHDHRVEENDVAAILKRFEASFERVLTQKAAASIDGWPAGANYMFRLCCDRLKTAPFNEFMWLEPDAIPLKPGWLDSIEDEFKKCGKPFMGDRVDVNDVPLHQSGIGIYCNPIFKLAGEAYRAHDIAWDVAAAHQIVPQAHWTEQIVHNWKHEEFKDQGELDNLLTNNPECVLFHSDKSGSIIKLMREKNLPAESLRSKLPELSESNSGNPARQSVSGQNTLGRSGGEIAAPISPVLADIWKRGDAKCLTPQEGQQHSAAPTVQSSGAATDIFIRTYSKDFQWLKYCLQSIHKFCTGFRKIWIVCPTDNPSSAFFDPNFIEWKVLNEETEDGYLSQQIHKLYADVITDYQPDYVLHIDSDTLFTRSVTPRDFFKKKLGHESVYSDKIIWYYTPYEHTQTPWQPITEKFMGKSVKYEFMRRLPMVIPKWLYPKLREYCYLTHKDILSNYIKNQPNREFSEFNALGAFAYEKFRDKFEWVNTHEELVPENCARQFFSHGGLTDEVKQEIQEILNGNRQGENADQQTQLKEQESDLVQSVQSKSDLRIVRTDDGTSLPSSNSRGKETGNSEDGSGRVLDRVHSSGNKEVQGSMPTVPQSSASDSSTKANRLSQNSSERSPDRNQKSSSTHHKQKEHKEVVGSRMEANGNSPRDHINALAVYADLPWKRQYVIKELKKKFKQKRKKREKLQAI